MVLLGLLPAGQFALLSSCRSSATRPWFQNEKTPAGEMPTEVAEGISGIRKPASCLLASIGVGIGGQWSQSGDHNNNIDHLQKGQSVVCIRELEVVVDAASTG